jgi:hypothetical protein
MSSLDKDRVFLVAREGVFAGVVVVVVAIAVVASVTVAVAAASASASDAALVPGVRVLLLALRGGVLGFIILDMFEGLYCMKNIV